MYKEKGMGTGCAEIKVAYKVGFINFFQLNEGSKEMRFEYVYWLFHLPKSFQILVEGHSMSALI